MNKKKLLSVVLAALMVVAVVVLIFTIDERKIKEKVAAEVAAYEINAGVTVETEDTAEKENSEKKAMPKEVKRSMIFLLASMPSFLRAPLNLIPILSLDSRPFCLAIAQIRL